MKTSTDLWLFVLFSSKLHSVTYFLITSSEEQFESSVQVLLQLNLCYTLDKQGHVTLPLTNELYSLNGALTKNIQNQLLTVNCFTVNDSLTFCSQQNVLYMKTSKQVG